MIDPRQDEIDRLARELQFEAEEKKRSPKQEKTNVVLPFAGAAAEEEKPSHAEILELLEAMDDVEYDRCRRAKAREWGLQLATLDRIRKYAKLRREYAQQQQKQPPQPDPNDLESRLRPILETEGILDLWLQSWDRVMAGEHRNAQLLYLVATSRLFDNCMHVAIKGPSSGGKSEIEDRYWSSSPAKTSSFSPRCRRRRCSITKATSATKSCRWQRRTVSKSRSFKTCCCAS